MRKSGKLCCNFYRKNISNACDKTIKPESNEFSVLDTTVVSKLLVN